MAENLQKIALGGGCHWCTEAVFQSLRGVQNVEQGFVSSTGEKANFSEAVIVHFDSEVIPLEKLIEIHLYTHKSTSNHSMRSKYRSAVYYIEQHQKSASQTAIEKLQNSFSKEIITQIFPFDKFKASREEIQNYYLKDPEKPFCKTFIDPKLEILRRQFSDDIKP